MLYFRKTAFEIQEKKMKLKNVFLYIIFYRYKCLWHSNNHPAISGMSLNKKNEEKNGELLHPVVHGRRVSWVVYMCSSWLQLASGSRYLSQAEKRITVI